MTAVITETAETLHCPTCGTNRPTYLATGENAERGALCCQLCTRVLRTARRHLAVLKGRALMEALRDPLSWHLMLPVGFFQLAGRAILDSRAPITEPSSLPDDVVDQWFKDARAESQERRLREHRFTAFVCSACQYEAKDLPELIAHAKAHGWAVLTVHGG